MNNSNKKWLLALGGNLESRVGDPEKTLRAALTSLNKDGLRLVMTSPLYETPCFPAGAGPDYINAAAVVETALAPADLLQKIHEIEADFGRARDQRWGGRTLDIDLIACDDLVLPDTAVYAAWRDLPLEQQMSETPDRLILPHPRLQDRAFVLVPLNDIAPGWVHPVSGLSVTEMLRALPETQRKEVKPLREP